jgi:hypothetical protein
MCLMGRNLKCDRLTMLDAHPTVLMMPLYPILTPVRTTPMTRLVAAYLPSSRANCKRGAMRWDSHVPSRLVEFRYECALTFSGVWVLL